MRTSSSNVLVLAAVLGATAFGIRSIAADGGRVDAAASDRRAAVTTTAPATIPPPAPAKIRTSLDPVLRVTGADATELAALDEAAARYRREGLALPDLDVTFFDDMADCRGHYGLFVRVGDPWPVSICSDVPFVITHELAHAWTAAHLDDADRDAYVALRGLKAWDGNELEWGERGVEDAAFIIQQNLMASTVDADSPRWIERMVAYEQLTGQASPVRRRQV